MKIAIQVALLALLALTTSACGYKIVPSESPMEKPPVSEAIQSLADGGCPKETSEYSLALYQIRKQVHPDQRPPLIRRLNACAEERRHQIRNHFQVRRQEYAAQNAAFLEGEGDRLLVIHLKTDHLEDETEILNSVDKSLDAARTLAYLEYLGFVGVVYRTNLKIIPIPLRPGRFDGLRAKETDRMIKDAGLDPVLFEQ